MTKISKIQKKLLIKYTFLAFVFVNRSFAQDPLAPSCESRLSPVQAGIVMEWNNYSSRDFGSGFRSGKYFLRARKYSFPYLYGIKLGRENIFEPGDLSLAALGAEFSYVFVEDSIITPTIMTGGEVSYSRNFDNRAITGGSLHALFSKEAGKIMPYFGPELKYVKLTGTGLSADSLKFNFILGVKFYTYPGASYGINFSLGSLGGWGIYFNNSW
ncbi:hypothetical protein KJ633_07405 [bacterium]|nr:hypothetical protein [bacterium]MBU3956273.1 hypothetical protein [bacterium]MBU4134036.1 hypothetical protein [bacterium]